ncbi:hypothetical protein [Streptomyces sp. NPDC047981]|uniref:hypothetical protein n=1 Tax=Streptomyces sp. NPDC047981 TaxID=3154610 RepID=UPI0034390BD8
MHYSKSYYVLSDSRSSFVRFKSDGNFTVGNDLAQALWERTSVAFVTNREFFQNDIYRALSFIADDEFDLQVVRQEGEDSAVVHIPLSKDCKIDAHFEVNGLRSAVG